MFGSLPYSLEFISTRGSPNRGRFTEPPERKRASLPDAEHMVSAAPAFGLTPSEKRTLDLVTDHPMIPRDHLARWMGVSEGRVSQMLRNLVNGWGLLERRGKRGDVRYTLSEEGIRYVTHRDRAQLPATLAIWSTELTTDNRGRRRHLGHRIETWARQTRHADGVTWFLSKLAAEARAISGSELEWSIPTAKTDRAFNWGESAIAPDAVGKLIADGLHIPFYPEHELRARHPRGVLARLRPYTRYYWSNAPEEDMAPFPVTLFVVDNEEVEEETCVRTASRMNLMTLPILVSCPTALTRRGLLGRSWRPLWESRGCLPMTPASLPAGITGFSRSGAAPRRQGSRWYGMSSTWTFPRLRSGSSPAPTANGVTLRPVALASSLARSSARSMSPCWMVTETSARR